MKRKAVHRQPIRSCRSIRFEVRRGAIQALWSLVLLVGAQLQAFADPPQASAVTIDGTAQVGFTLTGSYNYADVDNDPEGGSELRWLRNGSPVGGASSSSYLLVAADTGTSIVFEVTPVAQTGESPGSPVQSAPFGPIAAANTAPIASNVTVSGTAEVGFTLTGSYMYSDADGDNQGASTFRWLRNNIPIAGASGTQYTLVTADQGAQLRFEVTPVAQTGVSPGITVQSAPFGPIAAANTAPVASNVTVSGTAEVGFTLTGSYTYTDADNDPQGASTFRWLRNNIPIGGASGTQYTLVTADQGAQLRFEVTPVAQTGVSPGSTVQSAPFGPIAAANTAPTVTNVSIAGNATLGSVLTGNYTYSDANGDAEGTSTFRWLRNGAAISGATARTYTVVTADVENTLRFEVTPVAQAGVSPGSPVQSSGLLISNSVPSITDQADLSTAEDTSITIVLAHLIVSDPDSTYPDDFILQAQNGANYTRNGNTITPGRDFNGDLSVPVTVNDGFASSAVFNLQISVTPVNDRPTITSQRLLSTAEDTSLTIEITDLIVADPDNDYPADFVFLLQSGANYTLAGSGDTITPAQDFTGRLTVPAIVQDGELTSPVFTLRVTVTAQNDVPVLMTEIVDQNAIENSPFSLDISANFSDADGESLDYTAIWTPSQPPNISFNTNTGIFSGTPRLADTEEPGPLYSVVVTATDATGDFASDSFALTISALDRANVSLTIEVAPATAMPGDDLRWTFAARNVLGPQAGSNIELRGSFVGLGLAIAADAGASCTVQPSVNQRSDFVCVLGNLPVGQTSAVILTTTTTQATDVIAFATAAGAQELPIDPNLADNSAQLAAGVADAFSAGAVQVLGNASVLSVAAGDINGDGRTDIALGTVAGQPLQIYFGAAARESCQCVRDFATTPVVIPDTGANNGIALADLDNNGTLDIAVANGSGQPDAVYANDGSGNFSVMATLGASFSQDIAVGDFNNDGNRDIVFAASQGSPVYLGNGDGSFDTGQTLGSADSRDVAVGRFDNNQSDDIVFANVGTNSQVWIRTSTGFDAGATLPIGDASSVAAADLNNDGHFDLLFGRVSSTIDDVPANPVLINNGNGSFGTPIALLGISPTNDVHIGDVNNDGSPDLVFINASGVHQIWIANGGSYVLHGEQIIDGDATAGTLTDLGFTDENNAGGVDLALGGALQAGASVYLNDGAGNLGRGDAIPPQLTLRGQASVEIPSGSAYSDAGATAEDNIDGDISGNILVTNPVNTAVVGSYTVTYNVADFAGNPAAPIARTVTVRPSSGSGGGGGGAVGLPLMLLLSLILLRFWTASDRNRAIIMAGGMRKKCKDLRHDQTG